MKNDLCHVSKFAFRWACSYLAEFTWPLISRSASDAWVVLQLSKHRRNRVDAASFHTKMEVLQRQAYGFRNFNNYRLRVKVLCS